MLVALSRERRTPPSGGPQQVCRLTSKSEEDEEDEENSCEVATMSALPPAVLAKRAVQQERVRLLYRRSLKTILSWAVHRDLFYVEADKTRAAFESNKDEVDLRRIDRLLEDGEAKLAKMAHPDPYTVPWAPGGSKYARNPPVPPEIGLVYDFGRQEEW